MSRYRIYLTKEDREKSRYIETEDERSILTAIDNALEAAGIPAGSMYYDCDEIREE